MVRYDGSECPLYLQTILALAYVDQKHGWAGITPQVPSKYRIVEPLRHAVEYILNLDALRRTTDRRAVDAQVRAIEAEEQRLRGRIEAAATAAGGRVSFPPLPNLGARTAAAALNGLVADAEVAFEVLRGDEWLSLEGRIADLDARRDTRNLARVEEDAAYRKAPTETQEEELRGVQDSIARVSARLTALSHAEEDVDIQLGALGRRVASVDEERRRYSQLATLRALGAELAPSTMVEGDCPTCRQPLVAVEAIEGNALSEDETHLILDQERLTLLSLQERAREVQAANVARRNSWAQELSDLRARARALENDLASADRQPSLAELQRATSEQLELSDLQRLRTQVVVDVDSWRALRDRLIAVTPIKYEASSDEMTPRDQATIRAWVEELRRQLTTFQFTSVQPREIEIDETMRPVVDGYDISFHGSASDGIRLRWAYLLSLLAVCLSARGGQHPGFLIFDEPGQQGVEASALQALFIEAATTVGTDGQVILTTSEQSAEITAWLTGVHHQIVDLGGDYLLKPESTL